jgi:hypothetical protein
MSIKKFKKSKSDTSKTFLKTGESFVHYYAGYPIQTKSNGDLTELFVERTKPCYHCGSEVKLYQGLGKSKDNKIYPKKMFSTNGGVKYGLNGSDFICSQCRINKGLFFPASPAELDRIRKEKEDNKEFPETNEKSMKLAFDHTMKGFEGIKTATRSEIENDAARNTFLSDICKAEQKKIVDNKEKDVLSLMDLLAKKIASKSLSDEGMKGYLLCILDLKNLETK